MVNRYSIQVTNKSGAEQNYVLFSEPPKVTGSVQGTIWSNVLDTAETPENQNGTFTIYKQFFATCGNSHGALGDGVTVNVKGVTPINLGTLQDDGTPQPGTTLKLIVRKDAPYFDSSEPEPTAYPNAFEIDTQPDFSMSDARENNFIIGLGGSSGAGDSMPAAVFMPQPNVRYQIQPVNKYYIAYGDYTPGVLIDTNMIGQTVAIDFTRIGPNVKIIHNERGVMVVQTV